MEQTLLILSLNHRTAPVAVRERLAFADNEIPEALRRLKSASPSIREVALLSTCNRVEVVAATEDLAASRRPGDALFGHRPQRRARGFRGGAIPY